jgi:hypothetical protein
VVHKSIMDRAVVRVARLAGMVHAAGSRHGCSPRGLLEEEGPEGNLTVVGGGRYDNGARPAMSFNGGGYLLSMTRGLGWGETKVGASLDAVESGRGVGAFCRSGNGGRWAVKEQSAAARWSFNGAAVLGFDSALRGGEM